MGPFSGKVSESMKNGFRYSARTRYRKPAWFRPLVVLPLAGLVAAGIVVTTAGGGDGSRTSGLTGAVPAEAAEAGDLRFGQEHTWMDGATITVSKPKPFHTEEGSAPEGKRLVSVDMTIRNDPDAEEPYDVVSTEVTARHDDRVAPQVIRDGSLPYVDLSPGEDITITQVFAVDESQGVFRLCVKPSYFSNEVVYFVGQV